MQTGICIPFITNATGLGYLQQTTILYDFFSLPHHFYMCSYYRFYEAPPHQFSLVIIQIAPYRSNLSLLKKLKPVILCCFPIMDMIALQGRLKKGDCSHYQAAVAFSRPKTTYSKACVCLQVHSILHTITYAAILGDMMSQKQSFLCAHHPFPAWCKQ